MAVIRLTGHTAVCGFVPACLRPERARWGFFVDIGQTGKYFVLSDMEYGSHNALMDLAEE